VYSVVESRNLKARVNARPMVDSLSPGVFSVERESVKHVLYMY